MHASQIQNILWQNVHEGIHFSDKTSSNTELSNTKLSLRCSVDSFFFNGSRMSLISHETQ